MAFISSLQEAFRDPRKVWGGLRFWAGTQVENIGARAGIPETGVSERIAGGATPQIYGLAMAKEPGTFSWQQDTEEKGGGARPASGAPTPAPQFQQPKG